MGDLGSDETGGEQRWREEEGRKPCAATGEGAMGAMKVGGETEEAGGEGDDLGAREEEVEVGGREEEERALGVAGDEAAGRTGVRREKWVAEDGMVGGTTPPITVGLVLGAAAAAGELGATAKGE